MELSIQIKKYRTELHLSQEELAEKVDVYKRQLFGLSVSFAYRVVERMNADLASKNYYVCLLYTSRCV